MDVYAIFGELQECHFTGRRTCRDRGGGSGRFCTFSPIVSNISYRCHHMHGGFHNIFTKWKRYIYAILALHWSMLFVCQVGLSSRQKDKTIKLQISYLLVSILSHLIKLLGSGQKGIYPITLWASTGTARTISSIRRMTWRETDWSEKHFTCSGLPTLPGVSVFAH